MKNILKGQKIKKKKKNDEFVDEFTLSLSGLMSSGSKKNPLKKTAIKISSHVAKNKLCALIYHVRYYPDVDSER